MFERLGLIGCGLMGGSFALAAKQAGLVKRVVGYSQSPATLDRALAMGVIDEAAPSALAAATGADVVLLAVPVSATEGTLQAIRPALQSHTLLMDVGSTKRDVVAAAQRALGDKVACFVPAHPIAGKERAGVAHADALLYQGRQVILTPLEQTPPSLQQLACQVWERLGSHVRTMSPEMHDAAYAAVSHLPHLLAFAYMQSLGQQPHAAEFLSLAGPGFRDFSRIAASDPAVWRDIFLGNQDEVLAQSRQFRAALQAFESAIESGNHLGLTQTISQASQHRQAWRMAGD